MAGLFLPLLRLRIRTFPMDSLKKGPHPNPLNSIVPPLARNLPAYQQLKYFGTNSSLHFFFVFSFRIGINATSPIASIHWESVPVGFPDDRESINNEYMLRLIGPIDGNTDVLSLFGA